VISVFIQNFRHLGREEADVLNTCVGVKIAVGESEEVIDVCLAIQQMKEEAAREAAKKAAQEERVSTLLQAIKNLMENLGLTAEQAMNAMGIPETDRKSILPLM